MNSNLVPIIQNSSSIRVMDDKGRQITTIYTCAESVMACGQTFVVTLKGNNTVRDVYGWNGNSITRINQIYG